MEHSNLWEMAPSPPHQHVEVTYITMTTVPEGSTIGGKCDTLTPGISCVRPSQEEGRTVPDRHWFLWLPSLQENEAENPARPSNRSNLQSLVLVTHICQAGPSL